MSGPCYDIYVRLPRLDRLKVQSFLDAYVRSWREPDAWSSEDSCRPRNRHR
ncbi:hypothetical protein [Lentzea sp. NPDC051838]|uniref:hypothetical protein n=1 Tax=Lentzea sp. NPDC051838 TaxID=3154849 RepID=UPI00342F2F14